MKNKILLLARDANETELSEVILVMLREDWVHSPTVLRKIIIAAASALAVHSPSDEHET